LFQLVAVAAMQTVQWLRGVVEAQIQEAGVVPYSEEMKEKVELEAQH
jgi:hypothetical protein